MESGDKWTGELYMQLYTLAQFLSTLNMEILTKEMLIDLFHLLQGYPWQD